MKNIPKLNIPPHPFWDTSTLSWYAEDPSLNKFYAIMHEYWGGQAGSQPDGPSSDGDGNDGSDDGDDDVVEVPVPAPADPPVAPPAPKAKARMPLPPVPLSTKPMTLPATVPPPKASESDMKARVAALKTLTFWLSKFSWSKRRK